MGNPGFAPVSKHQVRQAPPSSPQPHLIVWKASLFDLEKAGTKLVAATVYGFNPHAPTLRTMSTDYVR